MHLLLYLSCWINYLDRGNLSIAAPVLAPEFGLDPKQMGYLLSAFFWTYSLLQPLGGWLVQRFNVYRVYAAGFAVWSLAVAWGGVASTVPMLFASRLVLGAGESVAYPAYSRILTMAFPEERRGFANAMIDMGTKAGPALGTLVTGLLISSFGWRTTFIGMGLIALIWIPLWLMKIPKVDAAAEEEVKHVSPWRILEKREAWITFAGLFCFNYAFYFLLTWLPTYFVKERHFSMQTMATLGSLPFAATAAASLTTAWWADRRIRHGASAGTLRKRTGVVGLLLCAALLPFASLPSLPVAFGALLCAMVGMGIFTANCWAMTQRMAGREAAGTWTGWQNAFGNMGGVAAPVVTGYLVSSTGSFASAFAGASCMLVLAAVLYGLVLRRVEPVRW